MFCVSLSSPTFRLTACNQGFVTPATHSLKIHLQIFFKIHRKAPFLIKCFPANFPEVFKITFLKTNLEQLLLKVYFTSPFSYSLQSTTIALLLCSHIIFQKSLMVHSIGACVAIKLFLC